MQDGAQRRTDTKEFHLMRSKRRTMLAALIAVLALSAVAASAASAALPEFVLAKGETFPVKLEAPVLNRNVSFSTDIDRWITCEEAGVKDEITSRTGVTVMDELTGCFWFHREECSSVGAAKGVIKLSGSGSVVYIEKSTKKVGVVLTLATTTIECGNGGGAEVKVHGNLLGAITPINTKTKTFELPYKGGKVFGEQEFTKYENEKSEKITATPAMNINGSGYNPMAFELSLLSLTASKALTISA